jgi:hypothetical protein
MDSFKAKACIYLLEIDGVGIWKESRSEFYRIFVFVYLVGTPLTIGSELCNPSTKQTKYSTKMGHMNSDKRRVTYSLCTVLALSW